MLCSRMIWYRTGKSSAPRDECTNFIFHFSALNQRMALASHDWPLYSESAPLAFFIVHVKYPYKIQTISPGNSLGVQGGILAADSSRRRRQRRLEPESTMTMLLSRGGGETEEVLAPLHTVVKMFLFLPLLWPNAGRVEARPHCGLCRSSKEGPELFNISFPCPWLRSRVPQLVIHSLNLRLWIF